LGHRLGQGHDVERGQVAEASLAAREYDHRLCVIEHVCDQRLGHGRIEEHQRTASLQNAEVTGHDLPVVLRHGHSHDLVRAREVGRQGCRHIFGLCFELSEGKRFSGVGNLQGRVIRKLPGGAAENVREPLDPLLVRNVHEVAVAKGFRQAVWTGIFLPGLLLPRPEVPPPRHKRQYKKDRNDGCQDHCCHVGYHDCRQINRSIAGVFLIGGYPGLCSEIHRPAF